MNEHDEVANIVADKMEEFIRNKFTVNKLTDAEIEKALECCKSFDDLRACYKCPALQTDGCASGKTYISDFIIKEILDLINRKDAEIERLNKEVDRLSLCVLYHDGQIADAKAEAIKEFIKKFKAYIPSIDGDTTMACVERAIKQAKKEMVGETDGQADK